MNIEFAAKDVEVTPFARDRVERKVSKMLSRFNLEVPVRVSVSAGRADGKTVYESVITMNLRGKEMVGSAQDGSVLSSLDESVARLDRQFNKRFDKLSRRERGRRVSDELVSPVAAEPEEEEA